LRLRKVLQNYGALVALLILVLFNAIWQRDVFLQPENIRNLLNQNAPVGILAVGMTLVIVGGGIDLSIGSIMALAAALGLLAVNKNLQPGAAESGPVAVGVVVTLASAAFLGLFNGLLIVLGRMAPFIATLAGLVAYRSMAMALADGGEIRSSSATLLPELGSGGIPLPFIMLSPNRPLTITWTIVLFFLVAAIGSFLLNRTRYGRHLIATGANERAAIYSAISTGKIKLITYTLLGLCAGIAAFTQAARMNSVATGQLGLYYELDAIAAVVIGGASMSGGRGKVWNTVIGVLILGIITNMLVISGVSVYTQGVVKGVIILLAVLIQRGSADR